jgi:hypothetical protein
MRAMRNDPTPSDDELAAALAAVSCYMGGSAPVQDSTLPERPWSAAAAVEAQGLAPARNGQYRAWASVERAGRAGRWSRGITGM